MLDQLRGRQERAYSVLDEAADSGDLRTALIALQPRSALGLTSPLGETGDRPLRGERLE